VEIEVMLLAVDGVAILLGKKALADLRGQEASVQVSLEKLLYSGWQRRTAHIVRQEQTEPEDTSHSEGARLRDHLLPIEGRLSVE
jgi:hypothetical protein